MFYMDLINHIENFIKYVLYIECYVENECIYLRKKKKSKCYLVWRRKEE